MLYRTNSQNGDRISQLAFGCMRLPGDYGEAERQIVHAIESGINYFDTAYIYPGNEALLGRILSQNNRRQDVMVATKMPVYLVSKQEDFDKYLSSQLDRLKTDHIDYYLIHMLPGVSEWARLEALGITGWIEKSKTDGKIANIGFSYHGGANEFKKLIDVYGWDFCMIQYNYVDIHSQAGNAGLVYAAQKGIPVMVMEPLRGGRLAAGLPKEAIDIFSRSASKRSPAEWGLRWVWNHPEVLTVLSGMNSIPSIDENVRAASSAEANSLTPGELEMFEEARLAITGKTLVPCTSCNYCMPCPSGVDIPLCFSIYNGIHYNGKMRSRRNYIIQTNHRNASKCTQCGKCEKHCPQSIPIRSRLKEVTGFMECFPYKPARFIIRKALKLK